MQIWSYLSTLAKRGAAVKARARGVPERLPLMGVGGTWSGSSLSGSDGISPLLGLVTSNLPVLLLGTWAFLPPLLQGDPREARFLWVPYAPCCFPYPMPLYICSIYNQLPASGSGQPRPGSSAQDALLRPPQPWHYWHLGLGEPCGTGCPVHYRVSSS